jgi:hypothetical protein
MFEKITLRRAEDGPPYSLGDIAEALLYYQNVHLILDGETLSGLLRQISGDELFELLSRHGVSATYFPAMLAVHTVTIVGLEHHNFVGLKTVNTADKKPIESHQDQLELQLQRTGFDKVQSIRLASKLMKRLRFQDQFGKYLVPGGLTKVATDDMFDEAYVTSAMHTVIQEILGYMPEMPLSKVEIFKTQSGFHAVGGVDLIELNVQRRRLNPGMEAVTMASLLGQLATARADLSLAAFYGSDFRTSSINSRVIQLRSAEILRRSGLNQSELQQFQEIVIDDAPSLREVIDGGNRSFSELMSLLDKSKLFKYWTSAQSSDSNLTREYFKEAQREGWLESLPAKGVRYLLGQALSAKLPIVGELFSVADSFLLEKMTKGWRPSHFVDKRYKPFLREKGL